MHIARSQWLLLIALVVASPALADSKATDLATAGEGLVGPGTITVHSRSDILLSVGAQVRPIPTYEDNWDFGIRDDTGLRTWGFHLNEGGVHTGDGGYLRTEAHINLNAMAPDRRWSFYARLEGDGTLDTTAVDERLTGNFGFERLHVTHALGERARLHFGWDLWATDLEAASLVYGEEGPGFWVDGRLTETVTYNLAYLKAREADRGRSPGLGADDDRSLLGGWLEFTLGEAGKVRSIALWDRMRQENTVDNDLGATTTAAACDAIADGDIGRFSTYWINKPGRFETLLQGVVNVGRVELNTPIEMTDGGREDRFEVFAWALAADLALPLGGERALTPAIGLLYASGDDDPTDDTLGGFEAGTSLLQFTRFGGMTTILGDHNPVLGTSLYSFLPSGWGNQLIGVKTGGLGNAIGGSTLFNTGRGDNPGLSLLNLRLTGQLRPDLAFRVQFNNLWFNEDFRVNGRTVAGGYAGTEWGNQLTWRVGPNFALKGEAALFFPGGTVDDITRALAGSSAEPAARAATELIWSF